MQKDKTSKPAAADVVKTPVRTNNFDKSELPPIPSGTKRTGLLSTPVGTVTAFPGMPSEMLEPLSDLPMTAPRIVATPAPPSSESLVYLDAGDMAVWEGNPRHVITKESLDELAESLAAIGQQQAVDVIPDRSRPGKYLIISGQRRWSAIRRDGINGGKVLSRIRTDLPSVEEIFAAAVDPQTTTSPLCDIDFAISLAKNTSDASQSTLAKALKRDKGEISKLMQIGQLPSTVLDTLKEHPQKFSYTFAYLVAQVCEKVSPAKAIEFAQKIAANNYTVVRAQSERDNFLGERKVARRNLWNTQRVPEGVIKLRPTDGNAQISLKGLTESQIAALGRAVNEILQQKP